MAVRIVRTTRRLRRLVQIGERLEAGDLRTFDVLFLLRLLAPRAFIPLLILSMVSSIGFQFATWRQQQVQIQHGLAEDPNVPPSEARRRVLVRIYGVDRGEAVWRAEENDRVIERNLMGRAG